ncbi:MAG: hypothetical protein ACM3WS_04585 [Bacillota bacterium]
MIIETVCPVRAPGGRERIAIEHASCQRGRHGGHGQCPDLQGKNFGCADEGDGFPDGMAEGCSEIRMLRAGDAASGVRIG